MRAVELLSVLLFLALLSFSAGNIEIPAWQIPITLLGGWVLADLFSGVVHWALDTFGTAHLPDHWPKKYGTVKFQPPESYLGQLAYPFTRKRDTPYG